MYKKHIGNILKLVCQGTEKGNIWLTICLFEWFFFFKKIDFTQFGLHAQKHTGTYLSEKLKNKNKKKDRKENWKSKEQTLRIISSRTLATKLLTYFHDQAWLVTKRWYLYLKNLKNFGEIFFTRIFIVSNQKCNFSYIQ